MKGRTFLMAAVLITALALLAGPAFAATITVTDMDDNNSGGASCTLRDAIDSVNNVGDSAGCVAVTVPNDYGTSDTISVPMGIYTLTGASGEDANASGDLDILKSVTIQGAGAGSTSLHGGGVDRVIHFASTFPNPAISATLDAVTITGGNTSGSGGGIVISNGALTVTNSTVSGNSAATNHGGIAAIIATVAVSNSTISGNSTAGDVGGIFGTGTVTVTNSTISGNSADNYGGIYGMGAVTVSNSTISGNTAALDYGGIVSGGAVTVSNSTISGNSADNYGGIVANNGGTITNATIYGNSATVNAAGVTVKGDIGDILTLSNTIVAGNTSSGGAGDCSVESGQFVTGGYNIDSDFTCMATLTGGAGGDSWQNGFTLPGLADNGGPTQTHALQLGNAALSAGSCVKATDQRGVARPQGGSCDIGAYEAYIYSVSVTVSGSGSVADDNSLAGFNIACGATCSDTAVEDSSVTLVATPDGGQTFTGWSGDCAGTGNCVLNAIGSNKAVTATFATAPTATTDAASGVGQSTATLNGTVNGNNSATTVTFEYGTTMAYGSTVTADQSPVAGGAGATAVSAAISGLACGTTYHFRVVGANAIGTTNGSDGAFTPPCNAADATTNAATDVGQYGATLNGVVNGNGTAATVTFEYGTTVAYGATATADQSPVAGGAGATAVSKAISGLTCGTAYHFRVVGVNSAGTTNGADQTFTTSACDVAPEPEPSPAPSPSPSPEPEPTPTDNGGDDTVTPPSPLTGGTPPSPPAVTDNGAPQAPQGNQPPNGGVTGSATVTFEWETPEDTHRHGSYLYVCESADFTGCETPAASQEGSAARMAAGAVGAAIFFGFMAPFARRRRVTSLLLVALLLTFGPALGACGSSETSTTAPDPIQAAQATLTLKPATTYYWKVMDLYEDGGVMVSETRSFTTPAQ